jgi:hypothetical protein
MFYSNTDGQYIQENTPFIINGIQYPANWLNHASPEEKAASGLEEVTVVGERGDDRFFWVAEQFNGATITFVNTPKQLQDDTSNNSTGLVTSWVNQINQIANSLLAPTDWMIIRKAERKTAIPADVTTYRNDVVTEANRLTTAIASVTTVEELIEVINGQNWPTTEKNV